MPSQKEVDEVKIRCNLCGADSTASEGKTKIIRWTVWGSRHSSAMSPHGGGLIGGPKEPPVLSMVLTKTSWLRACRGWGRNRAVEGGGRQVSHRIAARDELKGGPHH